MSVFARGMLRRVVTRVYFADEPGANARPAAGLARPGPRRDARRRARGGRLPFRRATPGSRRDRLPRCLRPLTSACSSPASAGTARRGAHLATTRWCGRWCALRRPCSSRWPAPASRRLGRRGRAPPPSTPARPHARWPSTRSPAATRSSRWWPPLRAGVARRRRAAGCTTAPPARTCSTPRWCWSPPTCSADLEASLARLAASLADLARVHPRRAGRRAHADPAGPADDPRAAGRRLAGGVLDALRPGPRVRPAAGVAGRPGRHRRGVRRATPSPYSTRSPATLGLAVPSRCRGTPAARRCSRSRRALVATGAACGKVAADLLVMAQTEVGEAREAHRRAVVVDGPQGQPGPLGAGRRGRAAAARARVGARPSAVAEQERPAGAWHAEWQPLRTMLRLAGGAAEHSASYRPGRGARPRRDGPQPGVPAGVRSASDDAWADRHTGAAGAWVDRVLARHEEVLRMTRRARAPGDGPPDGPPVVLSPVARHHLGDVGRPRRGARAARAGCCATTPAGTAARPCPPGPYTVAGARRGRARRSPTRWGSTGSRSSGSRSAVRSAQSLARPTTGTG